MTENQKRRFEDRIQAKPLDWHDAQVEQSSTAGAAKGGNTSDNGSSVLAQAGVRAEPAELVRPTDDHLWDETIRDRDAYHEWADKLADAIAKHFDAYIGEHSNMNCPWAEALEVIEGYEDEKPLHFAALLPGPYYMDPPDGGSVSILEQFRRMAEDAAMWRAHAASTAPTCEHCKTHLPLHLLTCPVAVKGMAEGKKKEAPEPLRQLLIDLSNNTYFCGLHLNDDAKYASYLAEAEKAEQALIELFAAPTTPAQVPAAEVRAQALEEAAKVADDHCYGPCGEYDYSYNEASAKADDRAEQIAAAIRSLAQSSAADKASEVRAASDTALLNLLDAWVERNKAAGYHHFVFAFDTSSTAREQIAADEILRAPSTADSGNTSALGEGAE